MSYNDEKKITIPASFFKAMTIDAPLITYFGPKSFNDLTIALPYKIIVATAVYEIRSTSNKILKELGFDDYTNAFITAAISGAVKGALLGQPILIPSINIYLYEICNASEFCANNKLVNVPLSIFAESIDGALGAVNAMGTGNVLALINVFDKLMNIIEIITSAESPEILEVVYDGAITGIKAGMIASASVNAVLIPMMEKNIVTNDSILDYCLINSYDYSYFAGEIME